MKKVLGCLYPFFFAIYPVLELRDYNIAYVDAAALFRPIVLSILITGLVWLLLRLFIKDWQKTGVIATLIMVALFSYGHVFIQTESMFGEPIRHRYLMLVFATLIISISAWIVWKVKNMAGVTDFLIITGTFLLVFALLPSVQHDVSAYQAVQRSNREEGSVMEAAHVEVQKPDIYLILLDAHTGQDVLKRDFGYDSSAFIKQLEDMGFYVAQCAQSNYPSTKLSVTSTFYADYHQQPALYPLSSSLVLQTVRSLGYKVITFENRSNGHFDAGEDMRLSRNQMALGRIDLTGGLSEFDVMLLKTSFFRVIYDMPQLVPGLDEQMLQKTEYYEHFRQTHFILDELKRLPGMDGPKFVFAHILVPHPPFIFARDGSFHWVGGAKGYLANVEFIDAQIAQVSRTIIDQSKIPPVIIIMGDHGPSGLHVDGRTRMSILNAYYVNAAAQKDLYQTITPVNSFRVVFNHYFGTNYPLFEDKSYYSYSMENFTPETLVPNKCQPPQ